MGQASEYCRPKALGRRSMAYYHQRIRLALSFLKVPSRLELNSGLSRDLIQERQNVCSKVSLFVKRILKLFRR